MANGIPLHIERLAEHIAAYVSGKPYAADTVAGIQTWWLSGATAGVSHGDVENAICILVQRGTLECRTLPDGTRIYAAPQPRPLPR